MSSVACRSALVVAESSAIISTFDNLCCAHKSQFSPYHFLSFLQNRLSLSSASTNHHPHYHPHTLTPKSEPFVLHSPIVFPHSFQAPSSTSDAESLDSSSPELLELSPIELQQHQQQQFPWLSAGFPPPSLPASPAPHPPPPHHTSQVFPATQNGGVFDPTNSFFEGRGGVVPDKLFYQHHLGLKPVMTAQSKQ